MNVIRNIFLTCVLAIILGLPITTQGSKLGSLKGIKWLQELPPRGGKLNDLVYGRLARPIDSKGKYVSWSKLANQLSQKGVEAVAFRIDKQKRYIDENGNGSTADEMANYHDEIKLITSELKNRGIKVLLFARIWLSNRTNNEVFQLFDTYLSKLTSDERNLIDGIAFTEIHLDDMNIVKTRARLIPSKFENAYPRWLSKRMFLIPGLDNGFRFTGIDQDDSFHKDMSSQVGEFAFVIKSMKLKSKDDPNNIYKDFAKFVKWGGQGVLARQMYFNDDMDIGKLVSYQESAEKKYPKMSNIVYWGDSGDAMTNVDPKAAQALHNVLNINGGKNHRGTFMYFGVGGKNMVEEGDNGVKHTVAKSIIWYDGRTDTYSKQDLEYGKWHSVMSVHSQWKNWFKNNPNYN